MYVAVADRVLVKEHDAAETSAHGVFLAPSAREDPHRGVVLSVGPRVRANIKEGDEVVYTAFEGQEFEDVDGGMIVVLRESEITAIAG